MASCINIPLGMTSSSSYYLFFPMIISDILPGNHPELSMFANTFIQVDFLIITEKLLLVLTEIPVLHLTCTAFLVTDSALVTFPGPKHFPGQAQ